MGGLAAVVEGRERRRYHGPISGVRGEEQMQNFSIPPHAVAENNGIEVGDGGGGGIIVKMVGRSGLGAESLTSPKKEVPCRVLICFLLTGNYI